MLARNQIGMIDTENQNNRVFCCNVGLDSINAQIQINANQNTAIGKEANIFPTLI